MEIEFKESSPGLTDVPGFTSSGVAANIRNKGDDRLDLGLVASRKPCVAAGVFTTNDVVAAPVRLCRERLSMPHPFHGIVANSGNANACTGPQGEEDALRMATEAETATGSPAGSFLVASTGRIGRHLPIDRVVAGIRRARSEMGADSSCGKDFAHAILTSDTRTKTATARFRHGKKSLTVAGVAKGAGMIEPGMATMLAFLSTDLKVGRDNLQATLNRAVNLSFNRITVDGDMSTNDTVLLLANGESGVSPSENADLLETFNQAVCKVCRYLAESIVGDGERVEHVVRLVIEGAATPEAADKVARAIGNSLLVKSSWFGSDPNWGRILDAAGAARTGIREDSIDLWYGEIPVLEKGRCREENLPLWKEVVGKRSFEIRLNLNLGRGTAELLSTDLTTGYVDFNKSE